MAKKKPKSNPAGDEQIQLAQFGAAILGVFIIPMIWTYAWLVTWLKHKGIGAGL